MADSGRMLKPLPAQPEPAAGFINEAELLERVPFSRRTLHVRRAAGEIPFIKLGARVIYHWPTVEQRLIRMQRGGS